MSKFLIPVYKKIGPVFVKGKGSFLWDKDGNRYLDLFPGWGVSILGHCHPEIVRVINEQSKDLIHLPNNLFHPWQDALAEKLVEKAFKSKVFFGNSGTEAVEAAIKFSRLYGRKNNRYEIITMKDSFHGRTFGSLSATGQSKYKKAFKPVLPGFVEAFFNDFGDFRKKVTKKTVGVMLELIQGEGGVNIATPEYVVKLRQFCTKNDLLFIADEVQTGMGRTSKLFCYQNYDIEPDIMLLSKGLGAGFPVSAILVKNDIADVMKPGMHASTFGGNPLASRVGLEVLDLIKRERVLFNVKRMGNYLIKELLRLKEKFSLIKDVRSMGLMAGVELFSEAQPLFEEALREKLIINCTHQNVLRIMPALNVKKDELDLGLDILKSIFEKLC